MTRFTVARRANLNFPILVHLIFSISSLSSPPYKPSVQTLSLLFNIPSLPFSLSPLNLISFLFLSFVHFLSLVVTHLLSLGSGKPTLTVRRQIGLIYCCSDPISDKPEAPTSTSSGTYASCVRPRHSQLSPNSTPLGVSRSYHRNTKDAGIAALPV